MTTELVLTPKQSKRVAKLEQELRELAALQPVAHPATIKEYVRRALFNSKLFTNREIFALTDRMVG